MGANEEKECCPRFDPEPWDGKEISLDEKIFVKDHVTSILHIPINFGSVMRKNMALVDAAGAMKDGMIVLSDEKSMWGADVFIETAKDVPAVIMARIPGKYLSKVFEGPYRNMGKWIKEMKEYVESKGHTFGKIYFYYTTCPRCAKKYGKNYVVILAQI